MPLSQKQERSASRAGTNTEWIIVAPRQEEDMIDFLLNRAPLDGIRIGRVLWSDRGAIKFYCSPEDLWEDLLASPENEDTMLAWTPFAPVSETCA